jgi:hypothetical protein
MQCTECKGTGKYVGLVKEEPCKACDGSGGVDEKWEETAASIGDKKWEGIFFSARDVEIFNARMRQFETVSTTPNPSPSVKNDEMPISLDDCFPSGSPKKPYDKPEVSELGKLRPCSFCNRSAVKLCQEMFPGPEGPVVIGWRCVCSCGNNGLCVKDKVGAVVAWNQFLENGLGSFRSVSRPCVRHGATLQGKRPVMKPTVGRILHFYRYVAGQGHKGPLAAIVTKVIGDGVGSSYKVNLATFDEGGNNHVDRDVVLVQKGESDPDSDFCCWPPREE